MKLYLRFIFTVIHLATILMPKKKSTNGLRKWFKDGGWDRYDSKGNKIGKCGARKKGEAKPKCLPASRAKNMSKAEIASAVRRKRREDPNVNRVGKAKNVATRTRKKRK